MAEVEVYIDSRHEALRKQLIPEMFQYGWQLLAFAAALGWSVEKWINPPAGGGTLSIKIPSDSNQRGDTLLTDIIAALGSDPSEEGGEEPAVDEALRAIQALNPDTFGQRCRKLTAYAHGGFDYMEIVKENTGASYREIVMALIADGPDPAVVNPMADV